MAWPSRQRQQRADPSGADPQPCRLGYADRQRQSSAAWPCRPSKTGGFAGTSGFLGYNVVTVRHGGDRRPEPDGRLQRQRLERGPSRPHPPRSGQRHRRPGILVSSDIPAASTAAHPLEQAGLGRVSMVDTGTGDTSMPLVFAPGSTAAARLLNLLGASRPEYRPARQLVDLKTTTATPLQSYVRTTPTSKLIPGTMTKSPGNRQRTGRGNPVLLQWPDRLGYTTVPPRASTPSIASGTSIR